ncbi:MAG: adenylosuccinate synthase [Chloroflexota bacterium]
MPAVAIIGAQWGDEGKGKVVDYLAAKVSIVVRYSGGNNAGHTVINQYGEFRLHLVPSGIFYPQMTGVIGNGVVVDPEVLLEEIESLRRAGVDTSHLYISQRATLIMPYHRLLDGLEEESRGEGSLGTTRKGVGPAYVDKAARLGIRVGELLDPPTFRQRLAQVLEQKNAIISGIYHAPALSLNEIYETYCSFGERLAPHICYTEPLLQEALGKGRMVLLEGAQGTLLDVDFGTYPYVTSSSPAVGGACTGAGVSPAHITSIIGVFKAYPTRVGQGPMPTLIEGEIQDLVRERAHEYGATTGRPRRCGWFDGVAAAYAARLNGFTAVALTRLDVLDVLPRIKVCRAYHYDGQRLEEFPASISVLEQCRPEYEEVPGWLTSTAEVRRWEELPPQARAYVEQIEELAGCPVALVSVGPRREQTIVRRPLL